MKLPFFRKKSRPGPSENDKMRDELHDQLDAAHEKLDRVLVKLRRVRQVAVKNPAKLRAK